MKSVWEKAPSQRSIHVIYSWRFMFFFVLNLLEMRVYSDVEKIFYCADFGEPVFGWL